ncbi:hypothetical protein [Streptomyces sp. NPDC004266]|uniref:hypothetical protein n=1 Tax=Streptomyces sp. NPDC004266 TaxID=3364693 RepID=UPI0036C2BDD7
MPTPQPWNTAEPSFTPRPFADELAEVSQLFREAFHQRTQPQMRQADLDDLQAQARAICQRVTLYMGQRTAELTGSPFEQLRMLLERGDHTSDSDPLITLLRALEAEHPNSPDPLGTHIRRVQNEHPDLENHEVVQIAFDILTGDRRDTRSTPTAAKTENETAAARDEQAADGPPAD